MLLQHAIHIVCWRFCMIESGISSQVGLRHDNMLLACRPHFAVFWPFHCSGRQISLQEARLITNACSTTQATTQGRPLFRQEADWPQTSS